jgi:protein TonB
MEANKILKADLLDILFENRNKAYGAYELRTTYPTRVKKSMVAMAAVSLVFITGVLLANSKSKEAIKPMYVEDVNLSSVKDKDEVKPVELPKLKPTPIRTIADNIPIILPDKLVDKTEVPTDDAIDNAQIGNITQDGADPDGAVTPPVEKEGTGQVIAPVEKHIPDFVTVVEIEAQFPGGMDAWRRFLQRNLNSDVPTENGAPAGRYTVVVAFNVDKEGNVSEIEALNDPGYGTAQEAVRVIKKSNQWIPAIQNGQHVGYRQKQVITFEVNEG